MNLALSVLHGFLNGDRISIQPRCLHTEGPLLLSPVFGDDHTGSDPSCAPHGDRAFSLFYVSERPGNNNSPNWHDAVVIH